MSSSFTADPSGVVSEGVMTRARIRLFGGFEVSDAAGRAVALPTRKAEALLSVLALANGAIQSRERLVGLFWADRGEQQARHSLSQTLTSLRRALGAEALSADRDGVALLPDRFAVDVTELRAACDSRDYDKASAASALYRGPLLEGFSLREEAFESWLQQARDQYHQRAVTLSLTVGEQALERGNEDAALAAFERAAELDPLAEPTQIRLLRLHLDRGRLEPAVRQYLRYADALRRELDLEPGPEITALWQEAVARQARPPARLETAGERKHVTALAIALSPGSSYQGDAEDIEAVLSEAQGCVSEVVRRHHGSIVQGAPEGTLALFGAPVAIEDHAARACRAALDVISALQGYGDQLRVAVAADSGEVILRPASDQGDSGQPIFGLCAQRAHRLAASGRLADIAVTRTTFEIARSRIHFVELESIPLDVGGPLIDVFHPTGLRVGADPGRELKSHFVGRESEAEALDAALEPVERGLGQLIALVGEAGIGKSRLVREFLQSAQRQGWRSIATGGDPQFADTAYFPIAGLLRSYFGLTEGADAESARARVAASVRSLDPDLAGSVTPLLGLLGDAPNDAEWSSVEPPERRRRLVDAVITLLHRQAGLEPLVVVVEDLHWLDGASRHVLESLVETLAAARILLIVNYRPEFTHTWAGRSFYRQVRIDPLPEDHSRALLDAIVGRDDSVESVKLQVIERAGGNPFFLEECVKAMEVSGQLQGKTGKYRFSGDTTRLKLPESIHAVIEARLDRLEPFEKQLLQVASVIGIEVPRGLILSVSKLDHDTFDAAIGRLQQSEFLVPSRVVPDTVFRFKHAVTHDVVHGSLLKRDRRELHGRVLEALEHEQAFRVSEQVDLLAFHAHRAEDWARAARYGRQAGMKAAARSANREAVTLYRQALAALQQLPETRERQAAEIDLHFEIRNALFVLGEPEQIMDHLKQASAIAAAIADGDRQCRADLLLSGLFWQNGEHRRAMEIADRAMRLTVGDRGSVLTALCHYRRGVNRHALGDYAEAVEDLRGSIAELEKIGAMDVFAFGGYPSVFCTSFLAWSLAELGELEEATRWGAQGWTLSRDLVNSYSRTVMSFGFATALIRAGNLDEARKVLEEGLELNRMTEAPSTYPWIASALGYTLVRSGAVDAGLELVRNSVSPEVRRRGPVYAHPYLWLAESLIACGDKEAAKDAAETGRAKAGAQEELGHLAWAERILGDTEIGADPRKAGSHYRLAADLAEKLGMKPLLAATRSSLAAVPISGAGPRP